MKFGKPKKLVDLSHTIEDGLVTYKGLPAPIICDYLSREESKSHYEKGTSFQIGTIEMCSNTGTYIDSPFHRYEDGKDISALELEAMASLNAVKVKVAENTFAVGKEAFVNHDVEGKAVLVETGWSKYWNTERYFERHPFLTEGAANYLMENGAKLVGIDSMNIDDTGQNARPVHSILLGAEILIVEHLCNLGSVPEKGFTFYAVPVKVKGMGTFPVRAFAQLGTS